MKTLLLSLAIVIAPLTAQAGGFTLSCGKIDFGRGLMVRETKIETDGTTLHYEIGREAEPPQIIDNTAQQYRRSTQNGVSGGVSHAFLMATQVDGHRIMTTFVVHLLEDKVRAVQEIESQTDQDGFLLSAATRLYSDCAYKER